MQPSAMPKSGGASGSQSAGSPDTMSFGRPVDPPEVGAFQAGEVTSGRGSSGRSGSGRYPAGSVRRPSASSGGTPMTTDGSASSRIASSSRAGQLGRHRLRDGADLPAGREGDEPFDRVGEGDRDHVARPMHLRQKVAGKPVGRGFELRSGDALLAAGDRRPVGILLGERGQPPAVGDEGHGDERIARARRQVPGARRRASPALVARGRQISNR